MNHTCYAYLIGPVGRQRSKSGMWNSSRGCSRNRVWTLEATHHFSAQKNSLWLSGKVVSCGSECPPRKVLDGGCTLLFMPLREKHPLIFFPPFFCPRSGNLRGKGFRLANKAAHAQTRRPSASLTIIIYIQTLLNLYETRVLWYCGQLCNIALHIFDLHNKTAHIQAILYIY